MILILSLGAAACLTVCGAFSQKAFHKKPNGPDRTGVYSVVCLAGFAGFACFGVAAAVTAFL